MEPDPDELIPLFWLACPAGVAAIVIGCVSGWREFVVGGVVVAMAGAGGLLWRWRR